jgi:cysteine sulfinate desulfinase/cysteine desulfurase-like protein
MLALGVGKRAANALVRLSLGRENTPEEIEIVTRVLPEVILRAQRANKSGDQGE